MWNQRTNFFPTGNINLSNTWVFLQTRSDTSMFSALGQGNWKSLEIKERVYTPYISFFLFLLPLLSYIDWHEGSSFSSWASGIIHPSCSFRQFMLDCLPVCQLIVINIFLNERRQRHKWTTNMVFCREGRFKRDTLFFTANQFVSSRCFLQQINLKTLLIFLYLLS